MNSILFLYKNDGLELAIKFPILSKCDTIEAETLMRNMKAKAREGYIKIDMPDEYNPIKFHNIVME